MTLAFIRFRNYLVLLSAIVLLAACKSTKLSHDYLNSPDHIVWSEAPLEWSDFRGRTENSEHTAYINWGIAWMKDANGKWNLFAHFSKRTSWHSVNSSKILRHEQYHFNLAEVYARLIRSEVITKKLTPGSMAFDKVFKSYLEECRFMQSRYDQQTMHSLDRQQQNDWERRIDKQMEELKAWKSIVLEW